MKPTARLLLTLMVFVSVFTMASSALAAASPKALVSNPPGYTVAIPCRFDGYASEFRGGLAVVHNGGKAGLIDKSGKVVVDFVYDSLFYNYPLPEAVPGGYYIAIKNEKWGVIDRTGKPLIPCQYDSIQLTKGGLALVGSGTPTRPGPGAINGLWGMIDLNTQKQIMPVKYNSISTYGDGSIFLVIQNSKVGLVDRKGKVIAPLKYSYIQPSDDWTVFNVTLGNKVGVIDRKGKTIVPPDRYKYLTGFNNGLAIVFRNGKTGVIDRNGRAVIPVKYQGVEGLSNGLAVVIKGKKYGVLSTSGKQVIPFKYDYGGFAGNGAVFMRQKTKTVIFNSAGKVIAPVGKYDSAYTGAGQLGDLIFVERQGKVGAIDVSGEQVIPLVYTGVLETKNGLARVTDNDRGAVLDQKGQVVLPLAKYGNINLLEDGSILVVSAASGRWGLRDRNGKTILPEDFWGIGPMTGNYVTANNEKGCAVFDKEGNMIVPFGEFDHIGYRSSENMLEVRKSGLFGYISLP